MFSLNEKAFRNSERLLKILSGKRDSRLAGHPPPDRAVGQGTRTNILFIGF